jgi:hypothetical protein
MRSLMLVCCLVFCLIGLALSAPLDLGGGGVYNSPEANAYWAQRFGGLGAGWGNFAALQASINAAALSRRP